MDAPRMPKSRHMANQYGKVCAAAIIALLHDDRPNEEPFITNTCYSIVSDTPAIHVASTHEYDCEQRTMLPVKAAGAGGLSVATSEAEWRFCGIVGPQYPERCVELRFTPSLAVKGTVKIVMKNLAKINLS